MNRLSAVILYVACVSLSGGCGPIATFKHYARQISLTPDAPRDRKLGITLLRVEPDGSTVIHVSRTGETLTAAPGEPFLGERGSYGVRAFGESGLVLLKSDPAGQTAVLLRRWAENRLGG